jgi:signal peptidase I
MLAAGLLTVVASLGALRLNHGMSDVRSESTAPTYRPGDGVVHARVDGGELRRGDVMLSSAPGRCPGGGLVMRRVIGVVGERIVCCEGEGAARRLTVNGRTSAEPYVEDGDANGPFSQQYDVRVPQGRLFLLGDHRLDARDSRYFADDHGGAGPGDDGPPGCGAVRRGHAVRAAAGDRGSDRCARGAAPAEFRTELRPAHF